MPTAEDAADVLTVFFAEMDARHWSTSVSDITTAQQATLRHFDTRPTPEPEEAVYSPEVFEAMQRFLASARGNPMLALRLAVSEQPNHPDGSP